MIVNSLKEWKALCTLFLREPYIAVDVETYAPDVPEHGKLAKNQALIKDRAKITTISVCTSFGSFVIGSDRLSTELKHLPATKVIRMMRPVLESPDVIKAFHNASYDVGVFSYAGIDVQNYVCTMLMGAVQDTNIKKGLKVRALGVGMYLHKIDSNKDLQDFLTYADEDALACFRLYEAYKYGKLSDPDECYVKESDIEAMKLEKWQRWFVFHQEFPVLKTMLRAERRGIQIDVEYLRELEKHTKFRREETLKKIYKHSDRVFNIDSPKQLAWFLFDHLELKSPFMTPKGAQSADKKALFYMKNAHPVINNIIEYRGINTLLKNYINTGTGIVAFTDRDFVVHCSINTHQAITGRFSVTNPALQTIPREDTVKKALGEDHSIRRAFIARPGYKLVALDYSQIELRLIAVYSKEKAMIEVLNDGGDIHQLTADRCGVPRQIAKNLNFGLCLVAGTKVTTEHGLIPIEKVMVGDSVLTHTGSWKPVTDTQVLPAGLIFKITTATGKEVQCTGDHKWLVRIPSKNGKPGRFEWVRAENLTEKHYLVSNRAEYGFAPSSRFLKQSDAILLGWFLSEGISTPTGAIRIKQSERANPDVWKRMKALLTLNYKANVMGDESCTTFALPAKLSKKYFSHIPEINRNGRSGTHCFTELIPSLSKDDARWVLAGLWDGDGSVFLRESDGRERLTISYTSLSPSLLIDIQTLLAQFGINSKIYSPHKLSGVACLHITGSFSKARFMETIPTIKTKRVSYEPKKCFDTEDKVKSIVVEKTKQLVYDITVAGDHSFIANGLVSHNCYGMGPWKLADMLTMEGNPTTEHQAKVYHEAYHAAYPGIKRLHNALVAEHNSRGYITCITGRRRHIPELMSSAKKDFSAGKRIAANNTIQISAGDLLKQSIVRIENDPNTRKRDIHTLLQIHDELLFEVPERDVEDHKDYLQVKMEVLPDRLQRPITVPIVAEGHYGDNWSQCK